MPSPTLSRVRARVPTGCSSAQPSTPPNSGPLHGVAVRVIAAACEVDTEALIEQAASDALELALSEAEVVELEPWVLFEVLAPAASSNAVLADLGARGADVDGVAAGRMGARLSGRAPLERMIGYVTRLRSLTKGLGEVSMRPDGFAPSATRAP